MKCAKMARRALGLFIVLIWLTGLAVTPAVAGNDSATKCINLFRQKKYKEAFPYCRQAAIAGNADAQIMLGDMYVFGEGVKKDYTVAATWFRKAAEQGNAAAQWRLGLMYKGLGFKKDYTEAVKWYRKAAEQGNADGQWLLGLMYELGKGVKKDYTEAVKWYRKAAEQGYAAAQFALGRMYERGEGVKKDGAVAADWYYRAGLSYLKDGKRDDVLRCVEAIKKLPEKGLTPPNLFTADKLLRALYGYTPKRGLR